MRLLGKWFPFLIVFIVSSTLLKGADDQEWRGKSPAAQFQLGGLTGLAIVDGSAGFGLLGTAAVKLLDRGFVPDINDQVFLEAQVGPVFVNGLTDAMISAHLRWDFHKDEDWTFYALGGLAGIFGNGIGSNRNEIFPRFGVGAIWELWPAVALRAEISHELMALGLSFLF